MADKPTELKTIIALMRQRASMARDFSGRIPPDDVEEWALLLEELPDMLDILGLRASEEWPRVVELANEVAELKRVNAKLTGAMWAAVDVVKEHVGPIALWPEPLREAFSRLVVADDQRLSLREIAWARKLAERFGWK